MGSLGNDNEHETKQKRRAFNVDIGENEARNFDSQFSPPSWSGEKFEGGGADELLNIQGTLPFNDTVPVEDPYEIQLWTLGGETQVLDDSDCIDTQLIDEFNNEVVIDSDGEATTDRTEVLDDVPSDCDSLKRVGSHSEDGEKMQCISPSQKNEMEHAKTPVSLTYKRCTAEHVRASGQAALGVALKGTNCGSFFFLSNNQSFKQHAAGNNEFSIRKVSAEVGEGNEECGLVNKSGKVEGLRRIGVSAVRKLNTDNMLAENEESEHVNNTNFGSDLHQPSLCNDELTGLSYVDSQVPEDAAHANALEFVERFIKVNLVELDEVHPGRSTREKSNRVSCAKGSWSLAKRASIRSAVKETAIFDFDESREDEGGGDLLCRRKEDLFDSRGKGRKRFTLPRKQNYVPLKGSRVDEYRNENKQQVFNKIMGLAHSDYRVVLDNMKENEKKFPAAERGIRKNLENELDEALNLNSSAGQLEVKGAKVDAVDMINLGLDTQLVAEAVKALSNGAALASHDVGNNQGIPDISKVSLKTSFEGEAEKRVHSKKASPRKRALPSDAAALTMESKKIKQAGPSFSEKLSLSPKKGSKVRRRLDTKLDKSKQERAKLNAEKLTATNGNGKSKRMPFKVIQHRKAGLSSHIDEIDRSEATAITTRCALDKKRKAQEEFGCSAPIAHRTRLRRKIRSAENVSNDTKEEKDDLIEVVSSKIKGQRSRGCKAIKVGKAKENSSHFCANPPAELENARKRLSSNQNAEKSGSKQSDSKLTDVTNIFGADTLSYHRGRTCRTLSVQQQLNEVAGLVGPSSLEQQKNGRSSIRQRRSKGDVKGQFFQSDPKRKTVLSVINSVNIDTEGDTDSAVSAEGAKKNASLEVSPRGTCKPSESACNTPASCMTPINSTSQICMGDDEYLKRSCRRNRSRVSLVKEINSLSVASLEPTAVKNSRRRDMTSV